MKHLITICLILALILVISCGERKNAISPNAGYSIVSTLPPVGIYRHLDLHLDLGIAFLSADYMGIIKLDMQDPGNPVIIDTLTNETYIGKVLSTVYRPESGYIYIESLDSDLWPKALWMFKLDTFETDTNFTYFTGSPPVENFSIIDFPNDSSGFTIVDSVLFIINDNSEEKKFQIQHIQRVFGYYDLVAESGYKKHSVYDYEIVDNYAYLAIDEYGMTIVDIENDMMEVGGFDTEGYCRGIDYQDGYCYLADRHWGLQVIDVSDPFNPIRVANLKFDGADDCIKVRVAGNRAVILDRYDGVFAVDISRPEAPKLIFNFNTITPEDIVITEEYIYVIDSDAGLIVASW